MPWNKKYKKEQQPKLPKKLVIKSRATILTVEDGHQAAVLIETERGRFNAYVLINSFLGSNSFTKAWDKAHYINANVVQYGHPLGEGWCLLEENLTLTELRDEGFQV